MTDSPEKLKSENMKAKEKAKKEKGCDTCTIQGSNYCRECYNFELYDPKDKGLDAFVIPAV